MSKTVIEIQIANVTAYDTGEYKVYNTLGFRPGWDLNVSSKIISTYISVYELY